MQPVTLGRYRIQSELGRGAMGIVYKAIDPDLERSLAIKTISMPSSEQGIQYYEARFYQEARAAAGLNSPNIVTIYDVGKSGDVGYIAMELIEGVELRALLSARIPFAPGRAVSIAAQVAEGLAFAHERGVVHRDIKPANIMVLASGLVKITDFGVARRRITGEDAQSAAPTGTPGYMSPEQALGRRADHRTDIFSLGLILYEMLAGTAAFGGEDETAMTYQIVNVVPPPPGSLNPDVTEALDRIVATMIAKPPDERYQGARDAVRDLRECERLMAAPAQAAPAQRFQPSTAARPVLLDTVAATIALARNLDRTRVSDAGSTAEAAPTARRISPVFNSAEATERLAALAREESAADVSIASRAGAPRPHAGWRARDWLVVAAGAALGILVAAVLAA